MEHLNQKMKFSWKDFLYKALIFTVTVSVIIYFLPRDSKFNYQFDLNRPWRYGQLIATFDFPIYKADNIIKQEQDSMLAHFQPYYRLDKQVAKNAVQRLQANYQTKLKDVLPSPAYVTHISRVLEDVFAAGVIPSEDRARMAGDSVSAIMVVNDNVATSRDLSRVFTIKEAYTHILMADTTRFNPVYLQQCDLNEYLQTNLTYEEERTNRAKEDMLANYSWAVGMVVSGQKIVDRGDIVDQHIYNILESYKKESAKRMEVDNQQNLLLLVGQILYVSLFVLALFLYLELYRPNYYNERSAISLLFSVVVFFCLATSFLVNRNLMTVYIIPYAMLPIIIRVFLDARTAVFTHVITIFICSICLHYPHEFILLQFAAGLAGVFSLSELSKRSQLFRSAFFVLLVYALLHAVLELISEGDIAKINFHIYVHFAINCILLLFTYPLLFLLEKTFRFTSNVTLVELSDINNRLLRQMSEMVPGTFQHSMQVSNLAAEAANRVGANSQLVRTGALYHDIGKMENPVFFTENQSGVNPHEKLSYEQSAQIVISHVTEGLKLAEKVGLPAVITDFIRTHHGLGKTKYFYISWMNGHPGETPDESTFSYPGPNPFTKEQAILMMADSVEAASRSLPVYTEESIGGLVDRIIDAQVSEGFFRECPITFKDIAIIKSVFKEKLRTMFHTRISYPEQRK
ncbi:MAG: HDIG domain-containing protein [Bacteroidales bacterium]|nr:HDIG domain-containing protein [Bacteroidales bacterium]